jgi:hypothetical protein
MPSKRCNALANSVEWVHAEHFNQQGKRIDQAGEIRHRDFVGRSLKDGEQVSVRTFRSFPAPRRDARRKAGLRLQKQLDRMAGKVRRTSRSS